MPLEGGGISLEGVKMPLEGGHFFRQSSTFPEVDGDFAAAERDLLIEVHIAVPTSTTQQAEMTMAGDLRCRQRHSETSKVISTTSARMILVPGWMVIVEFCAKR